MKKIFILIPLLLSLTAFQIGNYNFYNTPRISWKENVKLKWKDFKGAPDLSTDLDALTDCGIDMDYKTDAQGNWKITVTNYFDKKLSWAKDTSSKDLLQHEQLHFDICELYTRIARKRFSVFKKADEKSMQLIKTTGQTTLNEWQKEEVKYDTETNHGLKKDKQKIWNDKVKKSLLELKAFASK